jgi:NADH-quinone oxidoreductase subunit M
MTRLEFPVLLLLLVLPSLFALQAPRLTSDRVARRYGIAIATGMFLIASVLAFFYFASLQHPRVWVDPIFITYAGKLRPILGIDALSAPLLPLSTLIMLVVLVACPRVDLDRHHIGSIILTEVAVLGLAMAQDLVVLLLFWIGMIIPAWRDARHRGDVVLRRTYSRYQGLGILSLIGATVVLGISGMHDHLAAPLVLSELVHHSVPAREATIAVAFLVVAIIARGPLFPLQTFLPVMFERGHSGLAALLFVARPASYLVARVLLPLLPDAGPTALSLVADLGLVTAIWGGLLALAQQDLRRFVGALATSQSGLTLIGLASTNAEGLVGGLVYWVSSSLTLPGLVLVAHMVKARTGTTDIRRLGGLAQTMPRASALFLIIGLMAIGLPGSLGFIGEDLLVHGVLDSYPWVAAVQLIATLLNGVAFFRIYTEVFVGKPRLRSIKVPAGRDLTPRERFAVGGLVVATLAFGLAPRGIVHARDLAAQETLETESQHGHRRPAPSRVPVPSH